MSISNARDPSLSFPTYLPDALLNVVGCQDFCLLGGSSLVCSLVLVLDEFEHTGMQHVKSFLAS